MVPTIQNSMKPFQVHTSTQHNIVLEKEERKAEKSPFLSITGNELF